jgi:hypothetical protein
VGFTAFERLMQQNAMKARPRRRKLPSDTGLRVIHAIAPNVLDRQFLRYNQTANGLPTSLTSGPLKVGFMSLPSSTCSHGVLSAGR